MLEGLEDLENKVSQLTFYRASRKKGANEEKLRTSNPGVEDSDSESLGEKTECYSLGNSQNCSIEKSEGARREERGSAKNFGDEKSCGSDEDKRDVFGQSESPVSGEREDALEKQRYATSKNVTARYMTQGGKQWDPNNLRKKNSATELKQSSPLAGRSSSPLEGRSAASYRTTEKKSKSASKLHDVIENGSESELSQLLSHKKYASKANVCNSEGMSPLIHAASLSKWGFCVDLISAGANVNFLDWRKNHCLNWMLFKSASDDRSASLLRGMLVSQMGIQTLNSKNSDQMTCLHIASENGSEAVVQLLAQRQKESKKKSWDFVRSVFFFKRGVLLNCKNKDMDTPLHLAIRKGKEEVVKILLDLGADPTLSN